MNLRSIQTIVTAAAIVVVIVFVAICTYQLNHDGTPAVQNFTQCINNSLSNGTNPQNCH